MTLNLKPQQEECFDFCLINYHFTMQLVRTGTCSRKFSQISLLIGMPIYDQKISVYVARTRASSRDYFARHLASTAVKPSVLGYWKYCVTSYFLILPNSKEDQTIVVFGFFSSNQRLIVWKTPADCFLLMSSKRWCCLNGSCTLKKSSGPETI